MRAGRWLVVLAAAALLGASGCATFNSPNAVPVQFPPSNRAVEPLVEVQVATPGPTASPLHCTHNPPDLTVQVLLGLRQEHNKPASQAVQIRVQGLAAEEKLLWSSKDTGKVIVSKWRFTLPRRRRRGVL
jgi:hypothetical protein